MQPVLIGVHHYRPILIWKGNSSHIYQKCISLLYIYRELFGVHPTGINFELYDDIPVETSHMDYPPIDTVRISDRRSSSILILFILV